MCIGTNLGLIFYYKYIGFAVDNINSIFGLSLDVGNVVLPLAISFFTFQQIGYLVDVYSGKTGSYGFIDYALFVAFFPQLIAGPIVHHKEIVDQFTFKEQDRAGCLAAGMSIFFAGLFKKVIFADGIAYYSNSVFDALLQGGTPTFFEAWLGALAYTMQLYFDFSGYSDMAIGIAFVFGIRLPLNFNSPYKAFSIIDFWRRWHITLSNFLRDYLYIPLGGSRRGELRRNFNLMITMLLAGLWHGAGWAFVVWGGMHGAYLVVNHQWHRFLSGLGFDPRNPSFPARVIGTLVTFVLVVFSWVVFRAANLSIAVTMLSSMVGLNGISLPFSLRNQLGFLGGIFNFSGILDASTLFLYEAKQGCMGIVILLSIAWLAPNVYQWMGQYGLTSLDSHAVRGLSSESESAEKPKANYFMKQWTWRPNIIWSLILSVIAATSLMGLTRVSEFLYFQF